MSTKSVRRKLKPPPEKTSTEYAKLWRVVDGAVRRCFDAHPEYVWNCNQVVARNSINKRVVGATYWPLPLRRQKVRQCPSTEKTAVLDKAIAAGMRCHVSPCKQWIAHGTTRDLTGASGINSGPHNTAGDP